MFVIRTAVIVIMVLQMRVGYLIAVISGVYLLLLKLDLQYILSVLMGLLVIVMIVILIMLMELDLRSFLTLR